MTFEIVKVRRGLSRIQPLLDVLKEHNAFVCGGYARYCASPNTDKRLSKAWDVDVYCQDVAIFEALKSYFEAALLETRHENDLAITYKKPKDSTNVFFKCPIIQLIKPLEMGAIVTKGSVERVLENFDFTVVRCAIVPEGVLVDVDFIADESKKFLRIKKIHCPVSSLLRFMKYARKGYNTGPAELIKLFADWDRRSLEYRERIVELFSKIGELTQEEIDQLERLLRID